MRRFGCVALILSSVFWGQGCGDGGSAGSRAEGDPYYAPPTNTQGTGGSGGSGDPANNGSAYEGYWSDGSDTVSGDKYETVGTNPFVFTTFDPLSTFAADVDTASYDIFRRDAERNVLPHKDSVRLEEFINYFKYAYAPPAAGAKDPFAITINAAPSPFSSSTIVSVGIKGKELEFESRPANLVFLIDVSGSMSSSNKLPLVKKLLLASLEVLDSQSTISLVTYAGNVSVRLPPTSVTDKSTITAAINGLNSGGSTAGAAGIDLAYQQAELGFIEKGINHILLCSDGDFNVGASGNDALVALIEQKRKTGITLTVLGFGYGNLNDSMMEAITNAGNGIYGVISSEDQAIKYANERLLNTFNLIAKDVKIQVEFNAQQIFAYRLLGYENRDIPDELFTDDKVDAGEVGSGHSVTALYEVILAGSQIPTPPGAPVPLSGPDYAEVLNMQSSELLRVRVRYKGPNATEEDAAAEMTESLDASKGFASFSSTSTDFQWSTMIATFAEILKESPYAQKGAMASILSVAAANAGTDGDRLEFLTLLGNISALITP